MSRKTEIRYKPFSLPDALLGLTGSLFLIAGGAFLVFIGFQFAQQATNGDPGGLRYLFGGAAILMGVCLVLSSLYALYATITLPFDRAVKLCLSDEALTDYRFRPPQVIHWDEVRGVAIQILSMNWVRQSALATLDLGPGRESIKVELHGLDRDAEEIARLLADRIAGAGRESRPCPVCSGQGFAERSVPDFPGTIRSKCHECEGSGLTPGPARDEWHRRQPAEFESLLADLLGGTVPNSPSPKLPGKKRTCPACGGLSPHAANACYQCGKAFS